MPRKDRARSSAPRKTATCKTCGKRIKIPEGWSLGAAVRRHYWAKHREVMDPRRGEHE